MFYYNNNVWLGNFEKFTKMKEVLIVSIGFSPNVGGIETHFDDLTSVLAKRGWKVWVLTYTPITTNVKAPARETRGRKIQIYRLPWPRGFFYKLVKRPTFEFLYLAPGLFFALPIFLALNGKKIGVIHAHGLIAGFASVVWAKVFAKRVVVSTHSTYGFPKRGLYRWFASWIIKRADFSSGLSEKAKKEILSLGVDRKKVGKFTYWVDLNHFKKIRNAKEKINMADKFIVFTASRLIPEKGIGELLKAASLWDKRIYLIVSSDGPLKSLVEDYESKYTNIKYVGRLSQDELALYYSASDLLIIPSTHEEGFGRVIIESLACGTPVIGANRGAIVEAMDDSVGRLIEITPENIKKTVEYYFENPTALKRLASSARGFALKRYSEKNVEDIIKSYKDA